jgi:translation initiation factor 2B subunit (eIF-2B alpha/beta/delta family)
MLNLNNEREASMASWLGALVIAIVAAAAGITAAAIAHSAKISEFRQTWINALRDDIATYFKEPDGVHFYVGKLLNNKDSARVEELEQQKHEARALDACLLQNYAST